MKYNKFFIVASISLILFACNKTKTIELPLETKNSYGPFQTGFTGLSTLNENDNSPWIYTYQQVRGIPTEWTDVKKGFIETDMYQNIYQNYYAGNFPDGFYEEIQNSWNWTPDSINLSKKVIKTQIAFAYMQDSLGRTSMIVDTNNNYDFSDDHIFTPVRIDLGDKSINRDSLAREHAIMVTYECLRHDKIVKQEAPLFILNASRHKMFFYNFMQYSTAKLGKNIIGVSSHFSGNPSIVLMNDSLMNGKKIGFGTGITEDEYLIVKNKIYKNKGINKNKNVLVLERTKTKKENLQSTQIGFQAFDFVGENFVTKDSISLNDYRGKYVLVDFWAVWCGPCVEELPQLNTLYDKLDKSKVEIISVVDETPAHFLEKMINTHNISWPQILSDNSNNITKTYKITGYPTTYLINPEGVIIEKNLRGEALENKLMELSQ